MRKRRLERWIMNHPWPPLPLLSSSLTAEDWKETHYATWWILLPAMIASCFAYVCGHMKMKIYTLEDQAGVLWISPILHETVAQLRKVEKQGGLKMAGKINLIVLQNAGRSAGLPPFQGHRNWDVHSSESVAGKGLENESLGFMPCTMQITMDRSITAKREICSVPW